MSSQNQNGKTLRANEYAAQQFKKYNFNSDEPKVVEFFFYFPTKALAEKAGEEIANEGCDVTIELGAGKKAWHCFVTKEIVMLPDEL